MPHRPPVHRNRFAPPRPSDAARRGTSHQRGYGTDWRKFRAWFLSEHPLCTFQTHPHHRHECMHAATVVDHIKPLNQGGARLDPDNLRAVCRIAHARITDNLKATGKNELPPPKLPWGGRA